MPENSFRGHTGGRAERGHWRGRAGRGRGAVGRGQGAVGRGQGRGNKSRTSFERNSHPEAGLPQHQHHQKAHHFDQHPSQSGSLQDPPPFNPLAASVNYAVQSVLAPAASPSQQPNKQQQSHLDPYQPQHQPHSNQHLHLHLHQNQHPHLDQPQPVLRNVQNSIQPTNKPIIRHPPSTSTSVNPFTQFHPQPQLYPHSSYYPFAQTQHQFPAFNPHTPNQYLYPPSIPFPSHHYPQSVPFATPIHSPIQQSVPPATAGLYYYPQQHWGMSPPLASTSAQQPCPPPTKLTAEGYSISSTAASKTPECSQNNQKRTKFNHDRESTDHHRCGPCNQDFQSLTNLSMHLAQHLKCDYEDCKFEGLPKVLEIHQEDRHLIFKPGRGPTSAPKKPDGPLNATIHGLGYALKTQEQISSWIQDRKRRWPTAKVIAEKLAKAEPSTNRKGKQPQSSRPQTGSDGTHPGNLSRTRQGKLSAGKRQKSVSERPSTAERTVTTSTLAEVGESLTNNSSLSKAIAGENGCVNTDDDQSSMSGWGEQEPEKLAGASEPSGGMSEDMDPVRDAVSSKVPTACEDPMDAACASEPRLDCPAPAADVPIAKRAVVCRWWKMNRCKRGDSCQFDHPPKDPSAKKSVQQRKKLTTAPGDSPRPGLLSKLIEKDVEQEVADLLAVCEFLVQNGFLDNVEHRIGDAEEAERRVVEVDEETSGGCSDQLGKDGEVVDMWPQSDTAGTRLGGEEVKAIDLGVYGQPHPIGPDGGAQNLMDARFSDYP